MPPKYTYYVKKAGGFVVGGRKPVWPKKPQPAKNMMKWYKKYPSKFSGPVKKKAYR